MRIVAGPHWAEIKDVDDLTSGDADLVEEAAGLSFKMPEGEELDEAAVNTLIRREVNVTHEALHRQRDVMLAVLITAWSLGPDLPRDDVTRIKAMPLRLRTEIQDATGEHMLALRRVPPKEAMSSRSNGSSRAGRTSSQRA